MEAPVVSALTGIMAISDYVGLRPAIVKKLIREDNFPAALIGRRFITDTYLVSIWIWQKHLEYERELELKSGITQKERVEKRRVSNRVSIARMLKRWPKKE